MSGFRLLIAQVATILLVARVVGWLFGRIGQPRVIGEMVAGILLGPSLLGGLAPGFSHALFRETIYGDMLPSERREGPR
jgi:Kef-type K+ transport system membrane component KefB